MDILQAMILSSGPAGPRGESGKDRVTAAEQREESVFAAGRLFQVDNMFNALFGDDA